MDIKYFDNTRVSAYKTCPRSYFLRHVLHWTLEGENRHALIFGSSWHNGQDVIWEYGSKLSLDLLPELAYKAFVKTWTEAGLPESIPLEQQAKFGPRTPGIAYEMFFEYVQARRKMIQGSEILGIERPFAVPIPGLDNVFYIGKLDKAIVYNGRKIILEHKTTTAYAVDGNFRDDYVQSWYSSSQVKGYEFGGHLTFDGVDEVWVDAALVHKKIHNAFKFIPVSHGKLMIKEWVETTRQWIYEIINEEFSYEENGLLPSIFKKNEESCFGKYGTCPFLEICKNHPDPTQIPVPPGFKVEKWEPFETLGLSKVLENKDGQKD